MENSPVGAIYPNKLKTLRTVSGSLLMAVASGLLALHRQELRLSIVAAFLMCVGVVFFGFCFLYSFYRFIARKPILIINKEGILDHASALGVGLIKWEEIDTIGINRFLNRTFVGIIPKNTSAIILRQNIFKRVLLRINKRITAMPINIPENFLPMSAEQLLLRIKEFQSQSSTQYILTDTVRRLPKKAKSALHKVFVGMVLAVIVVLVVVSLFKTTKTIFSLNIQPGQGNVTYSCMNFGGYRFTLDDDWVNKSSKQGSSLVKGAFRDDIYFVIKDKPWELWFSIYKSGPKPAGTVTELTKQQISKELSGKKVYIIKTLDEKVYIGGKQRGISSIFLNNGQILSIIAIEQGNLSVLGFLSYDSAHLSLIKDLADALASFRAR